MKAIVEMPRISKDDIRINVYDCTLEVKTEEPQRKYHRSIQIPAETYIETSKSTYNNGILEITAADKRKNDKDRIYDFLLFTFQSNG